MAIAIGTEVTITLIPMECGECGCVFGISEQKYKRCKELGEGWHCPNGHSRVFSKPHNSELKEEVERLRRRTLNLEATVDIKNQTIIQLNYSTRALKAAKTKIVNRVKNGVCPCCNRTFQNLKNHFKSKHPELFEKNA